MPPSNTPVIPWVAFKVTEPFDAGMGKLARGKRLVEVTEVVKAKIAALTAVFIVTDVRLCKNGKRVSRYDDKTKVFSE